MSDLAGKRVLVVEDEYYIASDLQRALAAEGAVALGPAADLAEGLSLVEAEEIDGALLDVNLGRGDVYAIADRLTERSIPYILLSGYDPWSLPDRYRAAPHIGKPYALDEVIARLKALLPVGSVS